jgi:hypothetical protein
MKLGKSFWQCSACGKWSTANRKPNHHLRFVGEDLPDGAIIGDSNEVMEHDTGARYMVYWIKCGPFVEWVAKPVEEAA